MPLLITTPHTCRGEYSKEPSSKHILAPVWYASQVPRICVDHQGPIRGPAELQVGNIALVALVGS